MESIHFTSKVDDQEVKLVIKPESLEAQRKCDNEYSLAYVQAIQMGIPPRSSLEKLLRDQGMWSAEDDQALETLRLEIVKLELALQEVKSNEEGLPVAAKLAELRGQLIEVTQQRGEILNNSADFMAEQVRRDAFIAYSTYYETGKRVFEDYHEFIERAEEQIVLDARQAIAQAMFTEFNGFMDALPEAKYREEDTSVIAEANKELEAPRKKARKRSTRKKTKVIVKKE